MNFKRLFSFGRRNGVAAKPLLDREYIEENLESSPVPIILVVILIWMVSAVLLLLSENRQRDLTVWVDGQKAPFSVWARTGFSYEDSIETEIMREIARETEPLIFRIDISERERIKREFDNFFAAMQQRESCENEQKIFSPGESNGSKLASSLISYREILDRVKLHQEEFDRQLSILLQHGIAGENVLSTVPAERAAKVVSPDGRSYAVRPLDAESAAEELAKVLDLADQSGKEFIRDAAILIGQGNASLDQEASEKAANAAAEAVQPVIKTKMRGDLLIERMQTISRETVDMFEAEKKALPAGYGFVLLGNRLILSFLLLLTALFFLYRTYPGIFKTPHSFSIAGFALILGLLANFGSMQLFFFFFRYGIMPDYELMLFMVPIPFGASLLAILLGNRTALFSGFLVAAISSLMILPDRSFELALRWFAIAALMSLVIRNVSNYRSFFIRVFLGGALIIIVVNSDVFYSIYTDMRMVKLAVMTVLANSFACAICGLLAVFAFELIFNVDTSMSLMVLSDYNHPLLEKLKREAPGTMFHSMTVATLAEDAARAIRANPARAKAGALFHDIGKLAMPQYFVENNVDSPKDHLAMPPQRSCGIIRGHVKEGLALAREYRLCRFVRDAISSHHGNDLISFFYRRALENSGRDNLPVLESQFRYEGEPPCGKELTIISLADACEAASRSLNKPSAAKLESLVNDIFIGRLRGGQLRNSELTLEELDVVRECFIADLISFNHGRIAYQKESSDDTAALPMEESTLPCPEKK